MGSCFSSGGLAAGAAWRAEAQQVEPRRPGQVLRRPVRHRSADLDAAAAGRYGDERRAWRVRPSDDDHGGECDWDVDKRAAIFIDKFHRHQTGVFCTDCAPADQQQPQTPAATAAQ